MAIKFEDFRDKILAPMKEVEDAIDLAITTSLKSYGILEVSNIPNPEEVKKEIHKLYIKAGWKIRRLAIYTPVPGGKTTIEFFFA